MYITNEYLWHAFEQTGDINYYMQYKANLQNGTDFCDNANSESLNKNENNNLIYS